MEAGLYKEKCQDSAVCRSVPSCNSETVTARQLKFSQISVAAITNKIQVQQP